MQMKHMQLQSSDIKLQLYFKVASRCLNLGRIYTNCINIYITKSELCYNAFKVPVVPAGTFLSYPY